MSAYEPKTNTD